MVSSVYTWVDEGRLAGARSDCLLQGRVCLVRHLFRKRSGLLASMMVLFDFGSIAFAFLLTCLMVRPPGIGLGEYGLSNAPWPIVLFLAWLFQAIDRRLYISRRSDALVPELLAVTGTALFALLASVFVIALLLPASIDRPFAVCFCFLALVALIAVRLTARLSAWGLRSRGYNHQYVLFVGANERTAQLADIILSHEEFGYEVEGYLDDDETRRHHLEGYGIAYLGPTSELQQLLVDRVVDVVYVTLPVRSDYETIQDIAHLCEGVGVSVRCPADFFPSSFAAGVPTRIAEIPILQMARPRFDARFDLRRWTEFLESSILLVLLAPAFVLIAVLIRLDSKGPILVRETRKDRRSGREVSLSKFRTNVIAAPAEQVRGIEIASSEPGLSAPIPRVTRTGRWLRRYSLDELPQLMNSWLGHASFVEPRG